MLRFLDSRNQAAFQAIKQRQALEEQQLDDENEQALAALTQRQRAETTRLRQLWEHRVQAQEAVEREAEEQRQREEAAQDIKEEPESFLE